MSTIVCKVTGLEKAFGPNRVLREIDLDLPGGQVTALMGANGAGKSTLVKVLCGVHAPDAGNITLFDQPFSPNSPRDAFAKGVVTVHQSINDGVAPDLDVASNLMMDRLTEHRGFFLPDRALRREARKIAEAMHLGLDVRAPVASLGVADRQMIAIARAMVRAPKVLILDEPTSSLSAAESERLFTLIDRLRETGVAILYISHRRSDIQRIADRIVSMRDGRIAGVFDQAPLAEGRSTREPVDGAVALHGLGHAYEGVEVLADIDLELEDGSLVALVGPSGSGKSTLLHLLARYMDAQRGELEVGGLALKDMPDAVRHRHIALVGQQAAALEISLADNIALFRPDADLQEIRQAARDACLDERIMALPRGYDSVPGRDLQLSGGELQRLALARALLSPASLLLLDEPTSALDPQTARQVLRNLRERGGGRTRVIVAHRLAEVSDADLILVLVAGRLVERGEHAALLAADGAYARLWREQNGAEVAA